MSDLLLLTFIRFLFTFFIISLLFELVFTFFVTKNRILMKFCLIVVLDMANEMLMLFQIKGVGALIKAEWKMHSLNEIFK